jgi:glycosyltransferase involved in cell wall biosynthesis
MNILLVNWTWYPSGGDWTYIDNLKRLYEYHEHRVIPFSMQNSHNFATEYSKYFVSEINYRALNAKKNIKNGVKVLSRSIYSFEAKNKLESLLQIEKIEIAHLNNIHRYLTPSVISILKKYRIPIIWTLHDYTILCPESTFVSNGKVCEDCKRNKFYKCAIKRCKKESLLDSLMATIDNYFQYLSKVYDSVDYFLCPSQFLQNKFKEYGFNSNRLVLAYNCYYPEASIVRAVESVHSRNRYILYIGRLEKIKGIYTLIKSMAIRKNIDLKFVGGGPEEQALRNLIAAECMSNVQLLGKQPKEKIIALIKNSEFLVCPSEWYENLPYSIVEAMEMGKPVIGSQMGGIPELVIDGETGYTFQTGNHVDLANKIEQLWNDPTQILQLGKNARSFILKQTNPEKQYSILNGLFEKMGL